MRRRTLLSAAFAAGAGLAGVCATGLGVRRGAAASPYPSRPLTLIVPFSPGSSVGINARLLQPHLERALGQSVELQFEQGAGGIAGHLLGAEAVADGYTLTMVSASLTTQPWLNRASVAMPDNFDFIGQVTSIPSVLMVRADSQDRTLADLVTRLRAWPETVSTGNMVGWWPPALAQALFTAQAAIKPRVVSSFYSGPALLDSLSQWQLDFVLVGLADVRPSLDAGRLRALAVTSRTQALPATPSFQEQGWDVTTAWWRGLAVPKDTPAERTSRLSAALREALDSAALRADFARSGLSVDPLDASGFRQFVLDEYQTIGGLFAALGLNVRAAKPM
jgi:tripartite-type tricarboxylate transporter receptor subunit TctC